MRVKRFAAASAAVIVLAGGLLVWAQEKKQEESERKVSEAEVPATALAALKKLAGPAMLTEFSEEIEHGHKFYEGSWKGPTGNIDGLVTEAGDVVEIEETVPADVVPAAVRTALAKTAGADTEVRYEKKTLIMYEAHFRKDGRHHEVMMTPDGRRYYEEGHGEGARKMDKERDDEGDEDDDD